MGTSPRMRGKLTSGQRIINIFGNIPAYAGKTGKVAFYLLEAEEHPRVCGENFRLLLLRIGHGGTSPRMRGKQLIEIYATLNARNIPAYAGKTAMRFRSKSFAEEHPRVCGENGTRGGFMSSVGGTSPRMRGKRK